MNLSIENKDSTSVVKKVVVKLEGGLGNQFYQYAVGKALARASNAAFLVLDRMDSPNDSRRHNHLGLFNCQARKVSLISRFVFRLLFVKKWGIGKKLRKNSSKIYPITLVHDPETGYHPTILDNKFGSVLLLGYWQSYKYFDALRAELIEEFTLKSPPTSEENADLLQKINSTPSIAVHIRRGDYVNVSHFLENFGTCSLSYYRQAIKYIADHVDHPEFYVFSDDPDWAEANLIFSHPVKFVRNNLGVSDYEDFRLMKECKHFIIANSSFSWWAAYLSSFPAKMVLTPDRWFINDPMAMEDRIPTDWVRITTNHS